MRVNHSFFVASLAVLLPCAYCLGRLGLPDCNSGLLSATSSLNFHDVFLDPKRWGQWVETAVGAYLINHTDRLEYKLYFWRHEGDEVDFILQSSKKLIAIEVKSGRRQNNQGLPVFSEQFHPDVELVVGGEAFNLEQFLSMNLERLLE